MATAKRSATFLSRTSRAAPIRSVDEPDHPQLRRGAAVPQGPTQRRCDEHLSKFDKDEGVVFVGKAQEKTPVFRTERRRSPKTGLPYPSIVRGTHPWSTSPMSCGGS